MYIRAYVCVYVFMYVCVYMHACMDGCVYACLQWEKLRFCSLSHYSGMSFVKLYSVHILGFTEKSNSFILSCKLLKSPWALACERRLRFLRLGLECCAKRLELNQFIPVALFSGFKGCFELISPPPPSFSIAQQSNVDLCLLTGLLSQPALFFDVSFLFIIFHLLIYVCVQFHHLLFGYPLGWLPWA